MNDAHDLLRSWFRQRRELGDEELILEALSPDQLRDLLSPAAPSRAGADAMRAAMQADRSPPPQRNAGPAAERPRSGGTDVPASVESPSSTGVPAIDGAPPVPGVVETHRRDGAPVPGSTPHPPAPRAPRAPARYASAEEIRALPVLAEVRDLALGCPRCELAKSRKHVVFGEGNENADVLVVGEAPGQEEDRTGRPFVGKAGQLLDLLLMSSGFSREQVYICNVLKCRPPANRNPRPEEVDACSPYLLRQVELVQPRVILAFGNFAAQTLLGIDTPMGRMRGGTHQYRGIPLVPTYHPAACLRSPAWVRAVWEDLQRARALLDAA